MIVFEKDNREVLPDGSPNPNYGQVTQSGTPYVPMPNNIGNPYFGKQLLTPKAFWGLVMQVYIALASNNATTGLGRLGRLMTSTNAAPIIELTRSVDLIDTDDKDGAFLKMLGLLTSVNHEDGQVLMTTTERDAVMGAWPNA